MSASSPSGPPGSGLPRPPRPTDGTVSAVSRLARDETALLGRSRAGAVAVRSRPAAPDPALSGDPPQASQRSFHDAGAGDRRPADLGQGRRFDMAPLRPPRRPAAPPPLSLPLSLPR